MPGKKQKKNYKRKRKKIFTDRIRRQETEKDNQRRMWLQQRECGITSKT